MLGTGLKRRYVSGTSLIRQSVNASPPTHSCGTSRFSTFRLYRCDGVMVDVLAHTCGHPLDAWAPPREGGSRYMEKKAATTTITCLGDPTDSEPSPGSPGRRGGRGGRMGYLKLKVDVEFLRRRNGTK